MCNVKRKKVLYSFLVTSTIHNCHYHPICTQCRNLDIFLSARFYVKSILVDLLTKASSNIYWVVFTKSLSGRLIPKFPHCAILHIFSLLLMFTLSRKSTLVFLYCYLLIHFYSHASKTACFCLSSHC